ncbi:LysE family translocator [Maritalea sp.]|uniref:LysE family translocator n=1 Tax=Maritalea sp. TaxID=2003361 RepID=UPI003EF4EB72
MTIQTWLAFCAIAALNIFSPGPAILLAISNGATKGMFAALCQALGNALGMFFVSVASIIGVSAVLAASSTAFTIVKILGAAYLIYLGIKQIRSRNTSALGDPSKQKSERTYGAIFWEGFSIAITNPKAIQYFRSH